MGEFVENIKPSGQADPPKRPQHPESYLTGPFKCGQRREHLVRVHRSKWPPKANPSLNDKPYLTANCERCGAICIVYDPVPYDMTVRLYGEAGEVAGHVEDEVGAVVDDESEAAGGQVIDEPEPVRRGKR